MSTAISKPDRKTHIAQARAAANEQDCMKLYDEWASTYNDDVGHEAQNYVAPMIVAQNAFNLLNNPAISTILDAGCGTGLVGQALALLGAKNIDGLDLSPAMLKEASKAGIYQDLAQANLTQPIQKEDNSYDIVTCVGTFTSGHVGPDPALREIIRVTKKGGFVVATILEEVWVSGGFKGEVETLKDERLVEVVAADMIDYVKGHGDKAMMLVLGKLDHMNGMNGVNGANGTSG